ncbi:DUF6221 family protein [Nocardiopsis dassonvillei]|uniref:DUF6221 family protein n=1 Tax=Nocardiopsis dassonvillei TaxID=2014 RepID=UPI003642128C
MTITEFLNARLDEEHTRAQQMSTALWPEHVRVVPRADVDALDEGEPDGHVGVAGSLPNAWTRISRDGTVDDSWHMHPHAIEVWSAEVGRRLLADIAVKRAVLELHDQSHGRWVGFPRADRYEHYCMHDKESAPCPTLRLMAAVHADHPDYDRERWTP